MNPPPNRSSDPLLRPLPDGPDPEELLAQVAWVRTLALQVAGDPHAADDLTQDALLVALSAGGERPRSWKAWLSTVVRNLGRTRRRADRRRSERERDRARPERVAPTAELIERAATQKALVETLLELDEPYRSTLLRRFFEGRSARRIAQDEGLSESTVASRTAEGLRRLRSRLQRNGGDRPGAWLSALAPLLDWPGGQPPSASGATSAAAGGAGWLPSGLLLMSLKTKVALALLVLATPTLFLVRRSATPVERTVAATTGPVVAEPSLELDAPLALEVDRRATPAAEAPRTEEVATSGLPPGHPPIHAAPLPARRVEGLCVDLDGAPVSGVRICRQELVLRQQESTFGDIDPNAPPSADCDVTDPAGRFEIEASPPFQLVAASPAHVSVYNGAVDPTRGRTPLVVVAWRIPLGGRVVDPDGLPVPGARLVERVPVRFEQRPELVGTNYRQRTFETHADDQGRFLFAEAAQGEEAMLAVSAPGFLDSFVPVPAGGSEVLRVELARWMADEPAVAGRVFLPDGLPAEGARVSCGMNSALTASDGRFVIDMRHWLAPGHRRSELVADEETPLVLRAALPGFCPAEALLPSIAQAREEGWPADVQLFLGETGLAIRGRVVDQDGEPWKSVVIELMDPTPFGFVEPPGSPGWVQRWSLEQASGLDSVRTDREGRFEIVGLSPRPYRLEVLDELSLLKQASEELSPPADDVRIVMDRRLLGDIRGRLVDRAGEPVPGVVVSVTAKREHHLAIGGRGTTDEEGRFLLSGVTLDPDYLRLTGTPIMPELFRELPEGMPLDDLELRVGRRCEIQVSWNAWLGLADELVLVDEAGERIEMMDTSGGGWGPRNSIAAEPERTILMTVPDTATEALLLLGGEEVTRLPLDLPPGEITVLDL